MAKKVSAMTELAAGALAANDYFVVSDISQNTDRKVAAGDIFDAASSAYARTWMDDANAAACMTTLAIAAFAQGWLADATLAAWLATVGLDVDLATLDLPANTTISTYAKTWIGAADNAAIRLATALPRGWQYESKADLTGVATKEVYSGGTDIDDIEFEILFYGITAAAGWTGYLSFEDSSGQVQTGYQVSRSLMYNATISNDFTNDTGFPISNIGAGIMQVRRMQDTNTYYGEIQYTSGGTTMYLVSGYITLAGELLAIHVDNVTGDWTGGDVLTTWKKD